MENICVTHSQYLSDFTLLLTFNDGTTKEVNLESYLDQPIFEVLKDKNYFKKFSLNPFTIEWDNGADFAPEFLYSIGTSK
jgi:hypothetical protein